VPGILKTHLRSVALGRTKHGQGLGKGQEEEVRKEVCASPQAQGKHRHAQEGSILQAPLLHIKHFDCHFMYNASSNGSKALVHRNGELVQEILNFSLD